MLRRLSGLILAAGLLAGPAGAANEGWSRVADPAPGPARIEGFYSAGCLAGARSLPLTGIGYQVMRPMRNRYYGHPELVAFLQRLGQAAAIRGARLLIGDMSQPRGGPMNSGHISHQTGLDVDIWFDLLDRYDQFTRQVANTRGAPSVVDIKAGRLDGDWRPLFGDILRWVAQAPEVERVFVNPVIKRALCRNPSNHVWLGKLRPWWGHDDHFHVRLACPPDSPDCRPQDPPPPGSGCTADLDRWIEDQRHPRPPSRTKPKPIVLPSACAAILNARF